MSSKKWLLLTAAFIFTALVLIGGLTVVIDPYFHYHAPLDALSYELSDERQRYINDGISKHFEYDALLTGTSMMENARCSTFDELFGVNSVKVPYEGSTLKESDENLRRAIEANPDIKIVFRSLDYFILFRDKDEQLYPEDLYPRYLYDKNPFNDVSYVFNKTVLIENTLPTIDRTLAGEESSSFDEYSLMDPTLFGMEVPEEGFAGPIPASPGATVEGLAKAEGNVLQNVRRTVEENPQIDFYFMISPYSVLHWNGRRLNNNVDEQLDVEQKTVELLVDLENVHIFLFYDCPEIIGALDNYMDTCHFGPDTLDLIFEYMAAGEHRLTEDNYIEAFDRARTLFREGDLAALVQP